MATTSDFYFNAGVSTAMSAFRRVLVAPDGKVALATTTNRGIGVLQKDVAGQTYESAAVRLWGTGTQKITLAGTTGVAIGDAVYACADGRISGVVTGSITVGTGTTVGIVVATAPTALGDILEIVPTYTV